MKEILSAIAVLGVMGAAFGGILAVASRVFAVKTDERLPKLVDALPGANCGGCGFAGCQAYAQAVLDGRASVGQCGVGGAAYIRSRFTPDTTPGPGEDGEIVTVAEGQLQGTINDGIYRYLGVPYAEAAERFVTAGPVTPWEGVLKADSYGPMSPQGSMLGFGAGNQDGTDNNCQNLNIWTPGLNDGGLRPVLVWLHGGGFSTGTANDSSYDGEALAKNGDVVVVSVNHRLNVFGYLDLSAYDEKYKDSANVGM